MLILSLAAGFDNTVTPVIRCVRFQEQCALYVSSLLPPINHVKFFVRLPWWWAGEVLCLILHEFPGSLFLYLSFIAPTAIVIIIFKHWNKTTQLTCCGKNKRHFSGKKKGEWENPTCIWWVLIIEQNLWMGHYCLMVRGPKLIKDENVYCHLTHT